MKTKNELVNEVNKIPLFTSENLYLQCANEHDKNWKGIVEIGKGDILMPVSKHYKVVQFSDIFIPVLNGIPDLEGELRYGYGRGVLFVYPKGDKYAVGKDTRVGLTITNSVDKSMGLSVNFSILLKRHEYYNVVLPKGFSNLRKRHMGNVNVIVDNYQKMLMNCQDAWKIIIKKFDRDVDESEIGILLDKLRIGKKYNQFIRALYKIKKTVKLWNCFMDAVVFISEKNYKNEINRVKRLQKIAEIIYQYASMEALGQ